jgi:phenylpropionate dioxygenase-like ring-hydroxylating dioxygenase large terminal subunit
MTGTIEAALDKVPFRITDPERIPAKRYYDEAFFEAEKEHLWPRVWQMACRLEEIPEVGDYVEYTILDKSVIVVRGKQGVKAFKNACRHRGVRLANGPGNCGKSGFVCPFHGWRWNAEGDCTFVFGRKVFSEEALEQTEIDLEPVRIDFFAGCAFINFDDNARPLRETLGPIAQRLDARNADKLKMDWWCGTVLPTNWKLAMEAFQEGYHVMQTHPQLHALGPGAGALFGPDGDGWAPNMDLDGRGTVETLVEFYKRCGAGMDGMVHKSERDVIETLRDMEVPEDPGAAAMAFMERTYAEVEADARARGAPVFEIAKVFQEEKFKAVDFIFPHFFLLPMVAAMSSYRIRPLTPETCLFEIWSLVLRPEGEDYDTPTQPTILPYDSQDFPEIPRQDYSNLPIQQLGLHNLDEFRLARDIEGTISNYQRLIDGYLAGLDKDLLVKAHHVVNSGYDSPIMDIGFGPTVHTVDADAPHLENYMHAARTQAEAAE